MRRWSTLQRRKEKWGSVPTWRRAHYWKHVMQAGSSIVNSPKAFLARICKSSYSVSSAIAIFFASLLTVFTAHSCSDCHSMSYVTDCYRVCLHITLDFGSLRFAGNSSLSVLLDFGDYSSSWKAISSGSWKANSSGSWKANSSCSVYVSRSIVLDSSISVGKCRFVFRGGSGSKTFHISFSMDLTDSEDLDFSVNLPVTVNLSVKG